MKVARMFSSMSSCLRFFLLLSFVLVIVLAGCSGGAKPNPAPDLSTVIPQSLLAGSLDTTFTLTGANFISSSVVMAGTTQLATTFVSASQLTAVAPAALLAPVGTLSFAVSNPAPGGGSSQSISVNLMQPPAKLTSLSPSTATVGLTVTITGSYFTPTAAVILNGYEEVPTTYISATSIQFTVPAQELGYTGNLTITVIDPASQNKSSNALTLQIVNPVPALSSISPATVTAGAPNFLLTLTGSNFVPTASILINGAATQPLSGPSPTSASVFVPASAVSAVGTVTIAISNPAPGGGTSAAQTLNVISADNRVRTVNVAAADLGWDSAHGLLIASTLSSSTSNPNSIVAVDPLQGTVVSAQTLPSQPAGISVTGDGSYVYVTLPSTGQVERFTLPSLTPDITFGLGNGFSSSYVAAAPGAPHTVAISSASASVPASVVIYDDGVPRPGTAVPTGFDNSYDTLVWGADTTTIYGTNSVVSSSDEDTFSVNSSGVTLSSDQPGALGRFVKDLAFDAPTGRLVDGYGNVVNAATGQYAGQMQVQNTITYEENPFAMDSTQRVVFYLNVEPFYPNNPPDGTYIEAFNLDQFNYINSMFVDGLIFTPGLPGGSAIVRWGTSGLAINGPSQIYLIDGSFVAPSGISSAVGGYIAPSPTLTSVIPVAVQAGSPDVQVTLTGRDFTQASEVTWNNQTLLVDSVSDTQMVVTIPAALLTTAEAGGIAVTNGPGTGSSNAVAFTVLPNLGSTAQINVVNISGQDLAWDSSRSLLYVAVPATDPSFPNTIAVIDPAKPAINQTVPIPDAPTALSLSGDGQFLYSGFAGQAIVQRYTLPSFSLNLTIPTSTEFSASGAGTLDSCTFPIDVKAAPGAPHSIAVSEGNAGFESVACGGLAIYDDATPRSDTLPYSSGDFAMLAWGVDATQLYSQSANSISPQTLYGVAVSSSGVSLVGTLNSGGLGQRIHFDSGTNLLYSDSGVITNPVGPVQVGTFSAGGLVVPDSTLNRAFVLTESGTSTLGQQGTSYALNIYNLNTQALLNSIVIPDVLGVPTQMARWGANGIVFVTTVQQDTPGSAGVLYLLQGSAISGTP
jgi:hypothetical protein